MQLPSASASSGVYLDHIDHFEGAAEGWGDAEMLTQEQRDAIASTMSLVGASSIALRQAIEASESAERKATKLRARYIIRDIILDWRINSTSDAVLNGPAMRNREHPAFKRVFQEGNASDITDAKIREEPELAARILERFKTLDSFEGKAQAEANLNEAVSKSLDTLKNLDNAESDENTAGDVELQARLNVRMALEKAYGILRTAFPGQRKLVESFFLKRERAAAKAEPGSEGGR